MKTLPSLCCSKALCINFFTGAQRARFPGNLHQGKSSFNIKNGCQDLLKTKDLLNGVDPTIFTPDLIAYAFAWRFPFGRKIYGWRVFK